MVKDENIVSLSTAAGAALASACVVIAIIRHSDFFSSLLIIVSFFLLGFFGTYFWFSLGLVQASTATRIAELRKIERDYASPSPQPPALPSPEATTYNREIPRHTSAGEDTLRIQVAADKYDSIWREMAIRLLVWAEMKGGIKVGNMVGKGEPFPLASPNDWQALTDVLEESGYILKDGVSRVNPRYSSYSQAALVISRGGQLPHPESYPPSVRVIPEKLTIMPEWENPVNAG